MKTRFANTIVLAVILVFLGTGVSFADGWRGRPRHVPGHAYGHCKFKGHPGWQGRHPKVDLRHRCYRPHRPSHESTTFKLSVINADAAFKILVKERR